MPPSGFERRFRPIPCAKPGSGFALALSGRRREPRFRRDHRRADGRGRWEPRERMEERATWRNRYPTQLRMKPSPACQLQPAFRECAWCGDRRLKRRPCGFAVCRPACRVDGLEMRAPVSRPRAPSAGSPASRRQGGGAGRMGDVLWRRALQAARRCPGRPTEGRHGREASRWSSYSGWRATLSRTRRCGRAAPQASLRTILESPTAAGSIYCNR